MLKITHIHTCMIWHEHTTPTYVKYTHVSIHPITQNTHTWPYTQSHKIHISTLHIFLRTHSNENPRKRDYLMFPHSLFLNYAETWNGFYNYWRKRLIRRHLKKNMSLIIKQMDFLNMDVSKLSRPDLKVGLGLSKTINRVKISLERIRIWMKFLTVSADLKSLNWFWKC